MITETSAYILPPSLYVMEIGEITNANIVTNGPKIGQIEGNSVDITFITDNDLDFDYGSIRITVPIWGIDYEYDTRMKHIEYMHGDENLECFSD